MKFTLRRVATLAVATSAIGLTAGCSYTNPQGTAIEHPLSDGVQAEIGNVKFRNILIVSEAKGSPGRILGAAVNEGNQPVNMTITPEGGTPLTFTVPAKSSNAPGEYNFQSDANKQLIPATTQAPGALETLKLSDGTTSSDMKTPIVDGTLKDYRDYLPTHNKPIPTQGVPETTQAAPSASNMSTEAPATS
ncbi:MAG: hypothetical protein QM632_06985 [Micrococcaceae bacterium]